MRISQFREHKFYQRYLILKKFLRIMGLKPMHIILPAILSFISAFFDGIGLGLLIFLAKGMVSDFGFVKEIPILKNILTVFPNLLPASIATPNKSIFLFLVVLVFVAVLLKNAILYASQTLSSYLNIRFKYNVYKFVFDRFLSFGKLFFDRTSQGYITMVIHYSGTVMNMLEVFERSVNNLAALIIYFAIMSIISWRLTMVTIFIFPVLHFSLKAIIKKLQDISTLRNESWIGMNRAVFNILSCIPLIKAYSKEEKTKIIYAKVVNDLKKLDFRSMRIVKLTEPIRELIITMALLLMVSIVALLLAKDKPAEISVFVVFFYTARKALPLFNIFNEIKTSFAEAKPPLKEIAKVLDDKDKFFIVEGKKVFPGLKAKIEFNRLNFSYLDGMPVLKDISFSVEKGKRTAIVGPTGAGKTTLISLLMRFYDCPPSSIIIDGADIRDFTLESLRGNIALMSQEILLFNDTLKNNLIFGLDREISEAELINVSKKARIYDFIASLPRGFDTNIGDRGIKLSGGEKQRIAIARALLKDSDIFILDEAMSSLDSNTEKLIQEAIDEAIKDRTSIIIAHRFSTIKNVDKIIVIENGRFVEGGSLSELLNKKNKFYNYWQAQKFF